MKRKVRKQILTLCLCGTLLAPYCDLTVKASLTELATDGTDADLGESSHGSINQEAEDAEDDPQESAAEEQSDELTTDHPQEETGDTGLDEDDTEAELGDDFPEESGEGQPDNQTAAEPQDESGSDSSDESSLEPDNIEEGLPEPEQIGEPDLPGELDTGLQKDILPELLLSDDLQPEEVLWDVKIYGSRDGVKPVGGYLDADEIDLAEVDRYDMFYAYLMLSYENFSGESITDPVIKLQFPVAGDAGYYEPYTPLSAPSGWVAYSNVPTVDANAAFPQSGMEYDQDTGELTWFASQAIKHGETGQLFIKIPMRDPYTKQGEYSYNASFTYMTEMESPIGLLGVATLTIHGTDDEVPYTLTKMSELGFVPIAPDASEYYYHKYQFKNEYVSRYLIPLPDHHLDRFVFTHTIDVGLPPEAELVSSSPQLSSFDSDTGTLSFISFFAGGYTTEFVVRYPKDYYHDPEQEVIMPSAANGRFVGDSDYLYEIPGTDKELMHPVGAAPIPDSRLGRASLSYHFNYGYDSTPYVSEEALRAGSIPFGALMTTFRRTSSTIMADELVYEFNAVQWMKDGITSDADYVINMVFVENAAWVGEMDPENPTVFEARIYFEDGSSELLFSLTGQEAAAQSGALYRGNTDQKAVYDAPDGAIAKRFVLTVKHAPPGLHFPGIYVNGYITDYPEGGADAMQLTGFSGVYGYDTGNGRPAANGSGEFKLSYPILKDTKFKPRFTVKRTSSGAVNPGMTDTIRLTGIFEDKSTRSYVDPMFAVLLPPGVMYDSFNELSSEFQGNYASVYQLPDGVLSPPEITVFNNYHGSGRQLVRVQYSGILQEDETLAVDIVVRVAPGAASGDHLVNAYFTAGNLGGENNLDDTHTKATTDNTDLSGKGLELERLFEAEVRIPVTQGSGTLLYTEIMGIFDSGYGEYGMTRQGGTAAGNLVLHYNGTDPMTGIKLVSILPYEGDGISLWGEAADHQRVTLTEPVDLTAYPDGEAWYNLAATDDPDDPGWSRTFDPAARSVMVILPSDFTLQSQKTEEVRIPLTMLVPGTEEPGGIPAVTGVGMLPVKAYAVTGLPVFGSTGSASQIETIPLGIHVNVFYDGNHNGIKDEFEAVIPGLTVRLFHAGDDITAAQPLSSAVTDGNGYVYFFDNIQGQRLDFTDYQVFVAADEPGARFITGVGEVNTDSYGIAVLPELTRVNNIQNVLAGLIRTAEYELPVTGGAGVAMLIIAGLALSGTAGAIWIAFLRQTGKDN